MLAGIIVALVVGAIVLLGQPADARDVLSPGVTSTTERPLLIVRPVSLAAAPSQDPYHRGGSTPWWLLWGLGSFTCGLVAFRPR